jgi:hypothetical protein
MADMARMHVTSPRELEAIRWVDVVEAHNAVLRCSEHNREAAWSRFLEALFVFFGG